MKKHRFKIELLMTAEGLHLGSKRQKREDTITVLLWCYDRNEAEETARKISEALTVGTHVGVIACTLVSIKRRGRR